MGRLSGDTSAIALPLKVRRIPRGGTAIWTYDSRPHTPCRKQIDMICIRCHALMWFSVARANGKGMARSIPSRKLAHQEVSQGDVTAHVRLLAEIGGHIRTQSFRTRPCKVERDWQPSRMPLHSSSTTAAALAAGAASLSLVAGYVPLGGPASAFAPGLGSSRQARCLGQGATRQLPACATIGRPLLNLHMVDVSPRPQVDINPEDFVGSGRMGSIESEAYAPDDGGTEVTQFNDESDVLSGDEERDPGDVRNFPISDQTMDALARKGITKLFPVQSATFNEIYTGRDVLARARTGTGKTLGFALPILERLISDKIETGNQRRARGTKASCIILSPTRELAVQIEREIEWLTDGGDVRISTLCVYGGVPYSKQERELRNGVDMVVGTPGRMIDLYEKGALDLSEAKYLVSAAASSHAATRRQC